MMVSSFSVSKGSAAMKFSSLLFPKEVQPCLYYFQFTESPFAAHETWEKDKNKEMLMSSVKFLSICGERSNCIQSSFAGSSQIDRVHSLKYLFLVLIPRHRQTRLVRQWFR